MRGPLTPAGALVFLNSPLTFTIAMSLEYVHSWFCQYTGANQHSLAFILFERPNSPRLYLTLQPIPFWIPRIIPLFQTAACSGSGSHPSWEACTGIPQGSFQVQSTLLSLLEGNPGGLLETPRLFFLLMASPVVFAHPLALGRRYSTFQCGEHPPFTGPRGEGGGWRNARGYGCRKWVPEHTEEALNGRVWPEVGKPRGYEVCGRSWLFSCSTAGRPKTKRWSGV